MSSDLKRDLKNMVRNTEDRLAEGLLKWRYQKEGKAVPDEESLRRASREVSGRANRILSRGLTRVWGGMKEAYKRGEGRGGGGD